VDPDFSYHSTNVDVAAFDVPDGYTIHRNVQNATTMMHRLDVADGDVSMSGAPAPAVVDFPNPCNPADDEVINGLLKRLDRPLSALPGFVDKRDVPSKRLGRVTSGLTRRPSTSSLRAFIAPSEDNYKLELGKTTYEVKSKLGEGGFGTVVLGAATTGSGDDSDSDLSDLSDDENDDDKFVAIKIERPCTVWEGVMLDRVHRRVSPELAQNIVRPRGLHAFKDESFLLLEYSPQGTLLDVVNKAADWGITAGSSSTAPDELLALFFVAELLKVIEGLHDADLIHGDIKIDNCLVRIKTSKTDKPGYSRLGHGGWSDKGLRLIDFGRAIDLSLYPAGRSQRFIAGWETDARDCLEMREGRPWSYETDYSGLAGIAYCLLFGKHMTTELSADGRVKIDQSLRRYWQTGIWSKFFDMLLNPATVGELPITPQLADIRAQIETYLEDNCNKNGKDLKWMLKRIELSKMQESR
jgi:checkpoint serine/threonine-protein kinase